MAANVDPTRARWFMRSEVFIAFRKITDADGRFVLTPDVTAGAVVTMFGIPVTITNRLPHDASASDVVLADMSKIAVARDLAPSVKILTERYADFDQQAIRVVARYDAAPLLPGAVVILRGADPTAQVVSAERRPGHRQGGAGHPRVVRGGRGPAFAAAAVWGLMEGHTRRAIGLPRIADPSRFGAPEALASVALAATCRLAIDSSQARTLRTTDSRNDSQSRSGGFQAWALADPDWRDNAVCTDRTSTRRRSSPRNRGTATRSPRRAGVRRVPGL